MRDAQTSPNYHATCSNFYSQSWALLHIFFPCLSAHSLCSDAFLLLLAFPLQEAQKRDTFQDSQLVQDGIEADRYPKQREQNILTAAFPVCSLTDFSKHQSLKIRRQREIKSSKITWAVSRFWKARSPFGSRISCDPLSPPSLLEGDAQPVHAQLAGVSSFKQEQASRIGCLSLTVHHYRCIFQPRAGIAKGVPWYASKQRKWKKRLQMGGNWGEYESIYWCRFSKSIVCCGVLQPDSTKPEVSLKNKYPTVSLVGEGCF